jgi:septin family protein
MNNVQVPKRQHADCHRTVEDVRTALSSEKVRLNLVIVGHVDAGKSTLMGHLLTVCGRFSRGQVTRVAQEAAGAGRPVEQYAWAMTNDPSERAHGVTIEVGVVGFETEHLHLTVLDAPGHADFVGNMIAGRRGGPRRRFDESPRRQGPDPRAPPALQSTRREFARCRSQ